MSYTEHYRGTAHLVHLPEGQTLEEFAEKLAKERGFDDIPSYYKSALECMIDNFEDDYIYHKATGHLYSINKCSYEPDEEIIIAERQPDNSIDFEVRFYNGGASFNECLEEALDKLEKKSK